MALLKQFTTQVHRIKKGVGTTEDDQAVASIIANLNRVFQCRRTVEAQLGVGLQDYCGYAKGGDLLDELGVDLVLQINRCEPRLGNVQVQVLESPQKNVGWFEVNASLNETPLCFTLQLKR